MLAEVAVGDVPTTTSRLLPTTDMLLAEPPGSARIVPSAYAGTALSPPFRVTTVTTTEPTTIRITTRAATRMRPRRVVGADCIMQPTLRPPSPRMFLYPRVFCMLVQCPRALSSHLRGAFLAEQTLTESKTAEQQPTHGRKRAQDQQGSELVKVGPDKELHNPQDN